MVLDAGGGDQSTVSTISSTLMSGQLEMRYAGYCVTLIFAGAADHCFQCGNRCYRKRRGALEHIDAHTVNIVIPDGRRVPSPQTPADGRVDPFPLPDHSAIVGSAKTARIG